MFFTVISIANTFAVFVSILVNGILIYFIARYHRLRELSKSGTYCIVR